MSQATILEVAAEKPGVLQVNLPKLTGLKEQSIQKSINSLISWNRIRRERIKLNDKRGWTYRLWLVKAA